MYLLQVDFGKFVSAESVDSIYKDGDFWAVCVRSGLVHWVSDEFESSFLNHVNALNNNITEIK